MKLLVVMELVAVVLFVSSAPAVRALGAALRGHHHHTRRVASATQPRPPPPCSVCIHLTLESNSPVFPAIFDSELCNTWSDTVSGDIISKASLFGASRVSYRPEVACKPDTIRVCHDFTSFIDARSLQEWITDQASSWLQLLVGTAYSCPLHYTGYTLSVAVGGKRLGSEPEARSCLNARSAITC